jgi:hypothetical protein
MKLNKIKHELDMWLIKNDYAIGILLLIVASGLVISLLLFLFGKG